MAHPLFKRLALLTVCVVLWAVLDGVNAQSTNPRSRGGGSGGANLFTLMVVWFATTAVVTFVTYMVVKAVRPPIGSPSDPGYSRTQEGNFGVAAVTGFVGSIALMVIFWDAFFLPLMHDYGEYMMIVVIGGIALVLILGALAAAWEKITGRY